MTKKISSAELIKNVHRLITSEAFQELEYAVKELSLFSLVGTTHTERWHSAFIAWLLNPSAGHNLGTFPLKRFLMAMRLVNGDSKMPTQVPEMHEIEESRISDWYIMPDSETKGKNHEKTVSLNRNNRKCSFDIALSAEWRHQAANNKKSLLLIIENKVKAGESGDQTKAYAEWLNLPVKRDGKIQTASHEIFPLDSPTNKTASYKALVFLTPKGGKGATMDKHFVPMSYQNLMDFVLVPCLQNPRISDRGRFLLEEYIETLSDTGYCLTPRDRRCAKIIMKDFSETINDMLLAASFLPDQEGKINRGHLSVSIKELVNAGKLRVGDELRVSQKDYVVVIGKEGDDYGLLVDGRFFKTPSSAATAIVGKPCNRWDLFKATGKTLKSMRDEYENEQAEWVKTNFKRVEMQYIDSLVESKKEVFRLLERAIQDVEDPDFSLPDRYKDSAANFDYSILKEHLKLNEDGCVDAYFEGCENITASIDFSSKRPRIYFGGKPMSALKATKDAADLASNADKFTRHPTGSYRWSQYWYVAHDVDYRDKSFIQAYNAIMKKIER